MLIDFTIINVNNVETKQNTYTKYSIDNQFVT